MKAKELLAALKQLSAAELELEVYGYCDHGQSPEKVSRPSFIYTLDTNNHSLYAEYTGDREDASEYGYREKAILL